MERRSFGALVADACGSKVVRRGFTLVELLVSMTIILILAGITLAALNIGANADRVPGGSRQTQSMILGARDRAIYAGEPRGVRLIKDPDNANAVSSFVFIGAPQPFGGTEVKIEEDPANPGTWYVFEGSLQGSEWRRLVMRGLLADGAKIRFGAEDRWYTLASITGPNAQGQMRARLTRPYVGQPPGQPSYTSPYRVTLAPAILPNEEPRVLPRGVVIDLESSRIQGKIPLGPAPFGWYVVTNDGGDGSLTNAARLNDVVSYHDQIDILFNERGTIHGSLASLGVLSLLVVDTVDMQNGFRIWHSNSGAFDLNGDGVNEERDSPESVVTIYTNSGTVAVTPVDDTVSSSDPNVRTDPWYLAETGGEG